MGFFDGNPLSSSGTAQFSNDGGFDVANKKLMHGLFVLSLISVVEMKQGEAGIAHGFVGGNDLRRGASHR